MHPLRDVECITSVGELSHALHEQLDDRIHVFFVFQNRLKSEYVLDHAATERVLLLVQLREAVGVRREIWCLGEVEIRLGEATVDSVDFLPSLRVAHRALVGSNSHNRPFSESLAKAKAGAKWNAPTISIMQSFRIAVHVLRIDLPQIP